MRRLPLRDLVRRNVAQLCDVPKGKAGRPSKSLTLVQAEALLFSTQKTTMHAYIVVSLLTGARTEELRALTWRNLDLDGDRRLNLLGHPQSKSGGPSERVVTQRPPSHGEHSNSHGCV